MNYRAGMKTGGTFRANNAALASVEKIHGFLRKLIEALEMNALGFHVYDVPIAIKRLGMDPLSDEGGITGLAILSTSHVAIHTWPEEGGATFDLHSCREYNVDRVSALIREIFETSDIELHDLTFSLHEKS